jgi:hypothetical protein
MTLLRALGARRSVRPRIKWVCTVNPWLIPPCKVASELSVKTNHLFLAKPMTKVNSPCTQISALYHFKSFDDGARPGRSLGATITTLRSTSSSSKFTTKTGALASA